MRHQFWFVLALAACGFCLCGCGAFSSLTNDSSLAAARELYRDNLAELAQSGSDTAQATQASSETLVSIAEKLDQVIENTAPRRSRGVGSSEPADVAVIDEAPSPPEDAEPVSTCLSGSCLSGVSAIVTQSTGPTTEGGPPRTDTDAFDRLSEKLDQLTSKLDATRSMAPGNDVRTPDGTSVDVKSYIVDHGTGRFSYQGDIAAKLAAMGFNADEVSCLTLSEQHKLYDAWLSAHPPVATGAAVPAPVAAPGWRCSGGRCWRVR